MTMSKRKAVVHIHGEPESAEKTVLSFVAQSFNWIQLGSLAGGIEAEKNSHRHGKHDGDKNHDWRNKNWPTESFRDDVRSTETEQDSGRPSHQTQDHGLNEELLLDVAFSCANRHAEPDFSGTLRHGDQHDIHDADAANNERNASDRSQQQSHNLASLVSDVSHVSEISDEEIVIIPGSNAMAIAEESSYLLLCGITGLSRHS